MCELGLLLGVFGIFVIGLSIWRNSDDGIDWHANQYQPKTQFQSSLHIPEIRQSIKTIAREAARETMDKRALAVLLNDPQIKAQLYQIFLEEQKKHQVE